MKPIFFFSVECLILTKMHRLTVTQYIKMIKTYYKKKNNNCDFATATYRALRGGYGLHNRLITQEFRSLR